MWELDTVAVTNSADSTVLEQGGVDGLQERVKSGTFVLSQKSETSEVPKKIQNLGRPPEDSGISLTSPQNFPFNTQSLTLVERS